MIILRQGRLKFSSRLISVILASILMLNILPYDLIQDLFVDESYGLDYILWIGSVPRSTLYRDDTQAGKPEGYYWIKTNTGGTTAVQKNGGQSVDLPLRQKAYYNVPLHVTKEGTWQNGMQPMPGTLFASAGLRLSKNSIELMPGKTSVNVTNCRTKGQFYLSGTGDGNAILEIGESSSGYMSVADFKTTRSVGIESVGRGIVYKAWCSDINYSTAARVYTGQGCSVVFGSWFKINSGISVDSGGGGDPGGGDPDPPPPYIPDPPEPPYVPVPRQPAVDVSVNRNSDIKMNYKSANDTINISATATDRTNYNSGDYGDRTSLAVNLTSDVGNDSKSQNTSQITASAGASFPLAKSNLTKLNPVQFRYDFSGSGKVTLSRVGSATRNFTGNGYVTYTNKSPSTSIYIRTMSLGSGLASAPEGYYYVDTPTTLRVSFTDPENDIYRSTLYIAKKDTWANNRVEFKYQAGASDAYYVDESLFELTNVVKTINTYEATIKFKQPGNYVISSRVEDIKDSQIRNYIGASQDGIWGIGNETIITVRPKPEPPTAVISSPAYAFENEPYRATQQSTDPNDDIINWIWTSPVDQTSNSADRLPASSNLNTAGKDGGTITFPTGSAHHLYKITHTVTDATGLTDTTEKIIKVISNVPVADIQPSPDPDGPVDENNPDKVPPTNPDKPGGPDDNPSNPGGPNKKPGGGSYTADPSRLKQNRRLILSADGSLGPSNDPIKWDNIKWEVKPLTGKSTGIHQRIYNGAHKNSMIELQFEHTGTYEVKLTLSNNFSNKNPNHEDIEAATQTLIVTVIEDKKPETSIDIISKTPEFSNDGNFKPSDYEIAFRVNSTSIDGDLLPTSTKAYASKTYKWQIYEDLTNSGTWTRVPNNRLTYSDTFTEVKLTAQYPTGQFHNRYKAVVTTYETFAEPYNNSWLNSDGSWRRYATVETVEESNWKPEISIIPPNPDDPDIPDNQKAVYEDTDIDGDGLIDGKFIRVYQKDEFKIGTLIHDEVPAKSKVTWTLYKKNHSGEMTDSNDSGREWLKSSDVSSRLTSSGGTLNIYSPGIYMLKAVVKDDKGLTGEATILIRVYTLPIGVLDTNDMYNYDNLYDDDQNYGINTGWITKENLRWDIRSSNSIVDDEWGVAWHQMDFDRDWWEVSGRYTDAERRGQAIDPNEIHFMNADYADNKNALGYSKAIIEDGKYKSYTTLGTPDSVIRTHESSRLGWESAPGNAVDVVMLSGLNGLPNNDNLYQVGTQYRDDLNNIADQLESKLKTENSKYNIRIMKAQTTYDVNELFRTPDVYGYFDGFSNTADDEKNRYTVLHHTEYSGGSNGAGMSGTTYLAGNIGLMNMDDNGKECKFGVIQILDGYEPSHPEAAGHPFVGTAKVYARTGKVSSVNDFKTGSNWIEIASFGKQSQWDNLSIGELELLGPDSWRLKAANGSTIACSSATDIQFRVEFVSDSTDGTAWTGLVIRGWGGVYDDEYKMVTHTKSIEEVLNSLTYRADSLKVVVFNTNYLIGNNEITGRLDSNAEAKLVELGTYLKLKGFKFIVVGPSTLSVSVGKLVVLGVDATLVPISNIEQIKSVVSQSIYDKTEVVNLQYGVLTGNKAELEQHVLSDTNQNSVYNYIKKNATVTKNSKFRSLAFTEPGTYTIRYRGTNEYGKNTEIVEYQVIVTPDYAPKILGSIADKWYRNWDSTKNKAVATIRLSGLAAGELGSDNLTIQSPDGDYIDTSKVQITWDSDNSKTFTPNDATWLIEGSKTGLTQAGMKAQYSINGKTYEATIDYSVRKVS